jgi:hypothetical protein
VGDHELAACAQAQEGGAEFFGAGGANVHLGGADEDAFDAGIVHRRVEAQQDLDEGVAGEGGAERVGGRLVGPHLAQVDLEHGLTRLGRLSRGEERHYENKRQEDEEHDKRGKPAEECQKKGPHAALLGPGSGPEPGQAVQCD